MHAALQGEFEADHIKAGKKPPVADLNQHPEYKAARKLAEHEALPDKGERPDRDPQVCSLCGGQWV
jgi:hypothetical protein